MADIDIIKNGVASDKLAHAYIVESTSPLALESYANACIQEIGAHPLDVHWMNCSGKTTYRVEDSRELLDALAMNPYGERKIGLIKNAELLSEILQNKLLKTLEEPQPGVVIFLLCSSREALLTTVKSRCVLIRLTDASGDTSDKSGTSETEQEVIDRAVEMFYDDSFYYEFRAIIKDKNGIASQRDALNFLDALEEVAGDSMHAALYTGGKAGALTFDVEQIEAARRDILHGMGYPQALKRLYLELKS